MNYTLKSGGEVVATARMDVATAPQVVVRGNAVYLLDKTVADPTYNEVRAWWAPEAALRGRESGVP